MSTNSTPTPLPAYIYKILPSSPSPPSPLPMNLPLSPLDRGDKFLHMSTSFQILGTLNRFFSSASYVWILRVPYSRVEQFVRWEDAQGKGPDENGGVWNVKAKKGFFPHIYGNGGESDEEGLKLGREEIDDVGKWTQIGENWNGQGWPFGEDRPSE